MQVIEQEQGLTVEEQEELMWLQREAERVKEATRVIAARLEREAEEVSAKRAPIEERWYQDERQYHGRYDADTERRLKESKKSRLFVHLTRPKTDTWVARIFDMLFPSDEKNWGIGPTPVPELQGHIDSARTIPQDEQDTDQGLQKAEMAEAAKTFIEEARVRSEAMSREMEDQLVEGNYSAQCRDVIEFSCKQGTGILKGPIDSGKMTRRWVKDGNNYVLKDVPDNRPTYTSVNPWAWFPDPNATKVEEAEFSYEQHLFTKKQMRKLARDQSYDKDAIRRLLKDGPRSTIPNYIARIRDIANQEQVSIENKYVVWEYRGPLEADELKDLFFASGDIDGWEAIEDDIDPLFEVNVVVYVCQGEVLKFGIHHLDSEESIYSVFNFAPDSSSIWGCGVPALMRDSQSAINAGWRMMLDNGGLSAGPQVLVNQKAVEPADGSWELSNRKVWLAKDDAPNGITPFQVFNIESNQAELANIINFAKSFADEEVSLPTPGQNEQGGQVANTTFGLAMLMNNNNVVFRRVVKNFDDDLTVPSLRRLYDWNMQFSDKEKIKGDMRVDARGSSVLLMRELQSQNLMILLQTFGNDPRFMGWIKEKEGLKKVVQSMLLPANELIRTQEEFDEWLENNAPAEDEGAAADNGDGARLQIAQIEADTRLQVAEIQREVAMISLAEKRELKLEELDAMLEKSRRETDSKERLMAGEAGFKMKLAREEAAERAVEVGGTRFGGAT